MSGKILLSVDHESRTATLVVDNQSKLNAITFDMVQSFKEAIDQLETDDDVSVLIIRGAGGNLTSGADVDEVYDIYKSMPGGTEMKVPANRAKSYAQRMLWWGRDGIYERLRQFPKTVIVIAQGYCLEAGLYLTLCADFVIAGESARIGNPRWRYLGADGDLSLLISTVGLRRAEQMVFLGTELSGAEAVEWCLVDRVVPDDQIDQTVEPIARRSALSRGHGARSDAGLDAGLHVHTGFAQAISVGATVANLVHEQGEFNFLRTRRELGRSGAIAAFRETYVPFPANGEVEESPEKAPA